MTKGTNNKELVAEEKKIKEDRIENVKKEKIERKKRIRKRVNIKAGDFPAFCFL